MRKVCDRDRKREVEEKKDRAKIECRTREKRNWQRRYTEREVGEKRGCGKRGKKVGYREEEEKRDRAETERKVEQEKRGGGREDIIHRGKGKEGWQRERKRGMRQGEDGRER